MGKNGLAAVAPQTEEEKAEMASITRAKASQMPVVIEGTYCREEHPEGEVGPCCGIMVRLGMVLAFQVKSLELGAESAMRIAVAHGAKKFPEAIAAAAREQLEKLLDA